VLLHLFTLSKRYIDAFLKHAIPAIRQIFNVHREQFMKVFSILQVGTRILQRYCVDDQVKKSPSLVARIPALKKALEQLVFAVKSILTDNHAHGAFWLGNLKHRSIVNNEDISSQYVALKEIGNANVCASV
jgi:Fanconi anemia group D2 protein